MAHARGADGIDRLGLVVICGPMFSGKTGRLIEMLAAADAAGRLVQALKPAVDDRNQAGRIVSHDGRSRSAVSFASVAELRERVAGADLIGVDEVQFLPHEAADALESLVERGIDVISAGLDLDFRGEAFAVTERLASHAYRVERLVATCGLCGAVATHSQRLPGGQAAPASDPTVVIGGAELYAPRCEECFVRERANLERSDHAGTRT